MGIPLFNYGEDVFIRGVFAIREARWLHMVPTTKRTKPGRANILGIVDGTATTIEKGYTYYDTYNGIKLRDSFISISVDADGITGIVDSWKERTISAIPASMVTRENMISASAASEVALQHAESFNYAVIEPEVNGDLSYVPVGDNVYQLCYEITTTDGIVFISVLDGAIIEPAI